jgi:hypothetical protein
VGHPVDDRERIVPELLLGRKYGHRLHFWDMKTRKNIQTIDLGDEHQTALELRPAHDPTQQYGFVGVVVSVEDLSASIWLWHEGDDGRWAAQKVISIPAARSAGDSKRVYFTNSLYGTWDDQFYPDGVGAWMAKLDVTDGGMTVDERFFLEGEAFRGRRAHQIRPQGGDASSDSYCYPS